MTEADAGLLARFVASFSKTDDMLAEDVPMSMQVDPTGESWSRWQPISWNGHGDKSALEALYQHIPGRAPPLFEQLLLSYRWLEVELGLCRLIANPPATALQGFVDEVRADQCLNDYAVANRLFRFGKGPDINYDLVAFDLKNCDTHGDCPVVQVDHEEVFSGVSSPRTWVLAPSFREMVHRVIHGLAE